MLVDRKRANCGREPLLYVAVTGPPFLEHSSPDFQSIPRDFHGLAGFDSMPLGLVSLWSKRGVIDSSRGKWSSRMGESGGKGQFPEQREPERVRSRDVEPGLSRICY